MHSRESINATPGEFTVGTLKSVGGKITSDGINNFEAQRIDAREVEEYQHSKGFTVTGNIKDFKQDTQINHLLPPDKQSAQITTTDAYFTNKDYKAQTQTVISGAQGTHVQCGDTHGTVVTESSDGRKVTEDTSHCYHAAIPHMTPETKQQMEMNAKWAGSQLAENERRLEQDFHLNEPNSGQMVSPKDPQSAKEGADFDSQAPTLSNDAGRKGIDAHQKGPENTATTLLEPWQQEFLSHLDLGISENTEEASNNAFAFDSAWEQEAAQFYQNSQPIRANISTAEEATPLNGESLQYVYQPPKSYNEQAPTYFQEQMVGLYDDDDDEAHKWSRLPDLVFDENDIPKPPTRLANYQQRLSKPKDWHSSLSRWEREAVDDFTPMPKEINAYPEAPSKPEWQPTVASEIPRAKMPIYQLPKRHENQSTYQMLANKNQRPITVDPAFIDLTKRFGEKLKELEIDPIIELVKHPKEAFAANFERVKPMMGMNSMEAVTKVVVESAINYGSDLIKGDGLTRAAMLCEVVAMFATSAAGTSTTRFFRNAVSKRKGYYYHSVTSFSQGESVLRGIDDKWFKPDNRFEKGFYLSEIPETTVAELRYKKVKGEYTIRYQFNKERATILDLTKPEIAKEWGYIGGNDYEIPQEIAIKAQELGYNVVKYKSERGKGVNLAVFNNFEILLTPKKMFRAPKEPFSSFLIFK